MCAYTTSCAAVSPTRVGRTRRLSETSHKVTKSNGSRSWFGTGTHHDWRKVEQELNALPELIPTIDGVDIQFIHVRPAREMLHL